VSITQGGATAQALSINSITVASSAGALTLASTGSGQITFRNQVTNINTFTNDSNNAVTFSAGTKFASGGAVARTVDFGGSGNWQMNANLVTPTGSVAVKKSGAGTLTFAAANGYTGLTTVNDGALNITSTGSLNSGNALTVGASGTANLANAGQTLGAVSNSNSSTNALNFSASTGTVTLASLAGTGNTRFGSNGTVTGGISSGTVNVVGLLTSEISGGTVGAGSLSASTLSGGATTVGGIAAIGTMSSGTANLNGATSAITTLNGGTVNLGSSTVLTVSAGTTSGSITGSGGSLTKAGAGNLALTGTNTYTGTTTVAGGKLSVNGSTSSSSAVGVSSGASLGGSGTVGGNTTIASGGALAPGNSPGVLTVAGTTTFDSGSIFEWELDTAQANPTTNRGVAYDGVNTTSLAGSGAIFKILLTGTQDFSDYAFWSQTRSWTDIFKSADGVTTLTDWASVFSGGFQYSYNGKTVEPTSSGSFTLTGSSLTWSAVPEPTNALAGLLAAGMLLRRRRVA
jgi:autotransporter-associated beta strand protein